MVLYTDGLVERRGRSIDDGLERLRARAPQAPATSGRWCRAIIEHMVPVERPDDIAVIAASLPLLPDELVSRWPAEKEALLSVRRLVRRWLHGRGAGEEETYDITVACQEACANAVEHAYAPGPAVVRRRGLAPGRPRPCDRPRRRPLAWPRGSQPRRGLPLMRALMELVEVQHTRRTARSSSSNARSARAP